MPRVLRPVVAVVALLLALLVVPVAGAAPGGGNSPSAKACQKGGYTTLVRSDGSAFATEEACTSYAATGGLLVPLAVAQPCLGGGYANFLRADGTAFASQAACVSYAGTGGTLLPKPTATLTVTNLIVNGASFQTFTGTGLLPGSDITVLATFLGGQVDTAIIGTVGPDGTFSRGGVETTCGIGVVSSTVSATTATGGTITADGHPGC